MLIGNPQIIQYHGKLYRIQISIESYCLNIGSFESGDTAYLTFTIKQNGNIIKTIQIDYDETQEINIIYNEIVNIDVKPNDIIKTEIEETGESGLEFSWDRINIKLICSKIHY